MDKTERKERVNTLAVQAKADSAVIPELWGMVEQLIRAVCKRYCLPDRGSRLYDYDDLCQSAYLGFLKAIEQYNPDKGSFSGMLIFQVRNSCRAEIGLRGKRDALFDASSMSQPKRQDDETDDEAADNFEDADAEQDFENVIDSVYYKQLRADLDICMDKIPSHHADTLRARYYDGATFASIAVKYGVSAERARVKVQNALESIRSPEIISQLRSYREAEIIDESIKYSGFMFFKHNRYSSVEWAAEQLMLRKDVQI